MNLSQRWIWTFSLIFWFCHAGMQIAHKTALLSLEGQEIGWGAVALRPICESVFWFLLTPLLWVWVFRYGLKPHLSPLRNIQRAIVLVLGGVLLTYLINVLVVAFIFLIKNIPISSFDPFSARWGLHLAREPVPWLFLFVMTLLHVLAWMNWFSNQKLALLEAKIKWERLQNRNLLWVLQPHLIFNFLQNLMISPKLDDWGKSALEDLSDYLHCVFEGSQKEEVSLSTEISFLHAFLRLTSSMEKVVVENEVTCKTRIPTFSLQCLVENALKYGKGEILVRCSNDGTNLLVEVTNTRNQIGQKPGWGLGLQNLRERIQVLYGQQGTFLLSIHEGYTRACMTVPLVEER